MKFKDLPIGAFFCFGTNRTFILKSHVKTSENGYKSVPEELWCSDDEEVTEVTDANERSSYSVKEIKDDKP